MVEGAACFIWVFVQYWTYFQDLVYSALPLWVLASLAALAIPTRKRGGAEGMGAGGMDAPEGQNKGPERKPHGVSPDTLFAADGAVDRPSRQCFKTERAFRSVFSQRLLTTGERLWYTSTRILNRRL